MVESYRRFNGWLAAKITAAVSTMTCAYVFAALACVSLPEAIHGGAATLIAWIAQTFLQLVLLSVIMVGQEAQQRRHDDHAQSLADLHAKQDLHFSTAQPKEIPMSETKPTTTETETGAVAAPPANSPQTIEDWEAHKQSLIAKVDAELAAIPHEIVAEIKAAFAALKAHL